MRWYRPVAGGVFALLVAVVAAVRVFAPADTLDRAHVPYPDPAAAYGHVYGELLQAPLLIRTRMRVYAAVNRVWADGPVDDKMPTSALWAFRRWPAQLVGVVADDRVVVSKWSDGNLVAIDPDTGRIAWKADGGAGATRYTGRRTGAGTVYEPSDLYLAPVPGGPSVVASVRADGELTALDAGTGAVLWRRALGPPRPCRTVFTAPRRIAHLDRCSSPSTVDSYDAATGAQSAHLEGETLRPAGCTAGRSGCTGLAGYPHGWMIGPDGGFTEAGGLIVGPEAWLAGRLVVHPWNGQIVAHDAMTGAAAWSWAAPAGSRIVAAEPDLVHVVTPGRELVNLEVATGLERSRFPAHILGEDKPWEPGYVYAAHGYVVIERLLPGGRPEQIDSRYYYPFPTVLLTGS
jgi:outer membrane protein assembly factor BamB